MIGLARETAATFDRPFSVKTPEVKGMGDDINKYMSVEVKDTDLCPRYTARIVKNIKIEPSRRGWSVCTPAAFVRSTTSLISPNYVMLEYGQPMHAFDYKCLSDGRIVVRRARNGESIQTLDGVDHDLSDKMLAICDNDKPVAVAGVMGGANSRLWTTPRPSFSSLQTSTARPFVSPQRRSACVPRPPAALRRALIRA